MTTDRLDADALVEAIADIKGFVVSAVVLTCLETNLFRTVADGLSRASFVSTMTPNRNLGEAIVDVLLASGYVVEENGTLRYGAKTRALLDRWPLMQSWAREMRVTSDSMASLGRTLQTGDVSSTQLADFWPYTRTSDPSQLDASLTREY